MIYKSTKTFGHQLGLSVAFRQWRAQSHCRFLHGYALAVRFEFESEQLDERHWVVDFGDMKDLLKILESYFDHKTLVAADDPELDWFKAAHQKGILELVIVPATSCEKFAELIFKRTVQWLQDKQLAPRCRLSSVEVREHGANSAIYSA